MSFASFEFLLFFPAVTLIYFLLPHKLRWAHLLLASCGFYMFFAPAYILILAFTIIVDYVAGILIEGASGRRRWTYLALSLAANLGVLAFFKYYNFAAENVNAVARFAGSPAALPALRFLLPIGLSFHTFQAMSYTIEVYRGNQKAERHFGIYALYVMFYPQLVAGPIERPQNMLHQFHEQKSFDHDRAVSGLRLMLWGLFKKVVIADRLAIIADAVYRDPHRCTGAEMLIAMVAFTFQVYCDFSGYSDIALGSARVMGFTLMRNFDSPFRATSVTEFWRRWHISLSTWFNDYLFTPLFTAVRDWGKAGLALSLFVTFLLSGLWHGAGWTFVIYGALHGLALVYEALTKKTRKRVASRIGPRIYEPLTWVSVFVFVSLSFVFFRAASLSDAIHVVRNAFAVTKPGWSAVGTGGLDALPRWKLVLSFAPLLVLFAVERWDKDRELTRRLAERPRPVRWGLYYAMVAGILVFGAFGSKQFIYFQF